jgi:hypothetical protein
MDFELITGDFGSTHRSKEIVHCDGGIRDQAGYLGTFRRNAAAGAAVPRGARRYSYRPAQFEG